MKIRPVLIFTCLLTFLDVLSFGACYKKNGDKGKVFIHPLIEKLDSNDELYYDELYHRLSIEGKYESGNLVEYSVINSVATSFTTDPEGNVIKGISILGYFYKDLNKDNVDGWVPLEGSKEGITLTDDLIQGYYQGIRGAYHIGVLIKVDYE